MSAKKFPNRPKTPLTRVQPPKPGKTPIFKPQINSRLTRSLTNLSSDSQSSGNLSISVPKLIPPDWDLQCNLAYNKYLRAVAIQRITQSTTKEYEQVLDDQLARQCACLRRSLVENSRLEKEINSIELDVELKNLASKLEYVFIELNEILSNYNVVENLNQYIEFLKSVSNRLYLENIRPFKTQMEYDKFASLISSCADTLEKLKMVIDNITIAKKLGEEMQQFKELHSDLVAKQKSLSEDLLQIDLTVFKTISDQLASLEYKDVSV